jgi:hypothetical protein
MPSYLHGGRGVAKRPATQVALQNTTQVALQNKRLPRIARFLVRSSSWEIPFMARVGLIVAILVIAALLIGVVGLAVWDPPAPSAQIEKTIPNERFQR